MQTETKKALQERLAEWTVTQERFFTAVSRLPRPSQQNAYLARREEEKRMQRKRKRRKDRKADGALNDSTAVSQSSSRSASASASSSKSSSINTLTGCEDAEVLEIYPTLTRHDQKILKNEDKLAVAEVAHSPEFLIAKIEFLEDLLFIYQHEVEHQVQINSSAAYIKELKADLQASEDRISYVSTQLRKALDEVTLEKKAKEDAIESLTAEFKRAMERETQRREIATRDFEHERGLLKAKIRSVEAIANESVSAAKANLTSEAIATRGRVENYLSQIKVLEESVAYEQQLREEAETKLWEAQQELHSNTRVGAMVRTCLGVLREVAAKELRNQRVVFGELAKIFGEGTSGAWQWVGDPSSFVSLSIRSAAAATSRAKKGGRNQDAHRMGDEGDHSSDSLSPTSDEEKDGDKTLLQTKATRRRTKSRTIVSSHALEEDSEKDIDALQEQILTDLFPPDESVLCVGSSPPYLKKKGGEFAKPNLKKRRTAKGEPQNEHLTDDDGSSAATATAALEGLYRVVEKLGVMIAQYQADLLKCVSSGCESLIVERRSLKDKLLKVYAGAELQGRRAEETARTMEEQKEAAAADRDRALAARDKLARQLRLTEGSLGMGMVGVASVGERRAVAKNAECQTTLLGSSIASVMMGTGGSGGGGVTFALGSSSNAGAMTNPNTIPSQVTVVAMPSALKGSSNANANANANANSVPFVGGGAPHHSGVSHHQSLGLPSSSGGGGEPRRGVTIQEASHYFSSR